MKQLLTILFLVLMLPPVQAQNNGAEAKAAYLLAEEQFNAGKYEDCISYLDEAIKNLGTANSKILYLKIMSQRELAKKDPDYVAKLKATIESFEKLPDVASFNEEKFMEVMKLKLFLKKEGTVEKEPEDPTTASFRNYTIDGFNTGLSIEGLKKLKPNYFARVSKSASNGIESYLPQAGVNAVNLSAKNDVVFTIQKMLFDYFTDDADFSKGMSTFNNFKNTLHFNFQPVETREESGDKDMLSVTTHYKWTTGTKELDLSITKTTSKRAFSSYGFIMMTDMGIYSASPEALNRMAKAHLDNIKPEDVAKIKEQGNRDVIEANTSKIQANKNDHAAYYNRGVAKMNLNDYPGALDDMNQAISLNKKTAIYYKHRAYVKHFMKDYAAAAEDYSHATELDPNDIESYKYCASLKDQTGDYKGAVEAYTKLVEFGTKDTAANKLDHYYYMGVDRYLLKDFDGSYANLTKYIELGGRIKSAYYWRGKNLLLHRTNKAEAEKDFQKITETPGVTVQQAMSYYFMGNKEKALKIFDDLLHAKPTDFSLYYSRAGLYALEKDKTAALANLKLAFEHGLAYTSRMDLDENIDLIRDEPEYKSLIQQYKK